MLNSCWCYLFKKRIIRFFWVRESHFTANMSQKRPDATSKLSSASLRPEKNPSSSTASFYVKALHNRTQGAVSLC
jgi:hypothetical protein